LFLTRSVRRSDNADDTAGFANIDRMLGDLTVLARQS
jgi:hypothetical protein